MKGGSLRVSEDMECEVSVKYNSKKKKRQYDYPHRTVE